MSQFETSDYIHSDLLEKNINTIYKWPNQPLILSRRLCMEIWDQSTRRSSWARYIYGCSPTAQPGRMSWPIWFISSGVPKSTIPSTIHCNHLIKAQLKRDKDLHQSKDINQKLYKFLATTASKYIQDGLLEAWIWNYSLYHFGKLHTLGSVWLVLTLTCPSGDLWGMCTGFGGAEAVDGMFGTPLKLKFPKVIGVKLMGMLSSYTHITTSVMYANENIVY